MSCHDVMMSDREKTGESLQVWTGHRRIKVLQSVRPDPLCLGKKVNWVREIESSRLFWLAQSVYFLLLNAKRTRYITGIERTATIGIMSKTRQSDFCTLDPRSHRIQPPMHIEDTMALPRANDLS